jgi:hypothetical protein
MVQYRPNVWVWHHKQRSTTHNSRESYKVNGRSSIILRSVCTADWVKYTSIMLLQVLILMTKKTR